ncbi:MAG: hypothetical protein VX642_00185 [Bdellovibrionota bacterium]|nr:hypothetical protein [Bdellovibrionota bacterium]
MFAALKKQPKHVKIAIGVLILLVIGSLAIQPDKEFKMEGVTVSEEVIDLEEAIKQDEIYREKIRRQELGLEPLPGENPTKTQVKKEEPVRKTTNAKVKRETQKKSTPPKSPANNNEKVTKSKSKPKENKQELSKNSPQKLEEKKVNPVAEKAKSPSKRRLTDEANMLRISKLLERAPASMTELKAGISEEENNHYYILVRASEYFDTKIFVNQQTRINLSGEKGIHSFPIPPEMVFSQNMVDICYLHNDMPRSPTVREMVRVEVLNTEDWPEDRMPAMLNNLHVRPLHVSLSPTGKDFSPGDLNCESLLF